MLDYKCTLRNPKRCAFFPKCVYSDNFDQPMSTTQNPNQYICLCTSFKFYLDFQSWHDFFSKSVAHLQSAQLYIHSFIPPCQQLSKMSVDYFVSKKYANFSSNSCEFYERLRIWIRRSHLSNLHVSANFILANSYFISENINLLYEWWKKKHYTEWGRGRVFMHLRFHEILLSNLDIH